MILETKISVFKNTQATQCVEKGETIGLFLERIKNGTFKNTIEKILKSSSKDEIEFLKRSLPTVAMHGRFDGFRKKDLFVEASGVIILDIDDIEDDIEEVKEEIIHDSPHILSILKSPSGTGLKVLYYVLPELVTADNYREIGKQISQDFDIYGHVDYLSITDTLIMSHDPDIYINPEVEPAFIYVKEIISKQTELEPRDETKPIWEDAEDFFDTVLANDIESKTNNNYHYIQVSLLDLAKFGFIHPKDDLSFVIDYAEAVFKPSSENKKRFTEAAAIASNYPQIKWPYRYVDEDFDDEEPYIDYSEYTSEEEPGKESEEEESDGFIDPSKIFDRVVEVASEGDYVGREISLANFASIFRFKGTGILTVTGIPTSGKTEFIDQCILDLARSYDEESLVIGFEQSPEEHIIKLIRRLSGFDVRHKTWLKEENMPAFKKSYDYITNKISHLDTSTIGGEINKILEKCAAKIKEKRKSGRKVRYAVFDPFNMLSIKGKFSNLEKIEEILRRLTHFSHQMDVLVILIAHPFKMKRDEKTGEYEMPDFYSVKGSSAFYEMSYHGLVVHRTPTHTIVRVLKVKQNNLGEKDAEAHFLYDKPSGRYIPIDEDGNETKGDHRDKDWLEKAI